MKYAQARPIVRPTSLAVVGCLMGSLSAASLGCVGTVAQDAREPAPVVSGSGAGPAACTITSVAPAPLRRLTRVEYNNTVRDLFGVATRPADAFPAEEVSQGFAADARFFTVSPLLAERLGETAIALAPRALDMLAPTLACVKAPDDACARAVAERLGRRAFRRPLDAAEVGRYVDLFRTVRAGWDAARGLQAVVEAMLMSPHFLYKIEVGQADPTRPDLRRLTPHEVATRLSYYLWQTTPDEALLEAAASGKLATADGVEEAARRMMAEPRVRVGVLAFFEQWLELYRLDDTTKDPTVYPVFTPALRDSMRWEAQTLVDDVVWSGAGLRGLLTTSHTFVDEGLAAFYGTAAVGRGATARVELDARQRTGILTLPAVLATHAKANQSSPVVRGMFVRHNLLCQVIPDPPPGLMVNAPDPKPGISTRERFAVHAADPSCAGCHRLMDPLGLAFENFDGVGRWRTEDGGKPIDASGEVFDTRTLNGKFVGAGQLAQRLAGSDEVFSCFAQQWFQNVMGRARLPADQCAIDTLTRRLLSADGDIRELLLASIQSEAFLFIPEAKP